MKPILFSTQMVQAILEGRKSQTRRIIKPQPVQQLYPCGTGGKYWAYNPNDLKDEYFHHNYGLIGDVLWVRETIHKWETIHQGSYSYTEGEEVKYPPHWIDKNGRKMSVDFKADIPKSRLKWTPSIFMPFTACRLFLEVVDVRAEKLQDISEEDARREGCDSFDGIELLNDGLHNPTDEYRMLWDSINGKGAWERNEWVWVISFKQTNKPK